MKAIVILLVSGLFFLHSFTSKANPIIEEYSQVFISELYFDAENNWTLELELFLGETFPSPSYIDSVIIQTNSGRARLLSILDENNIIFLVTGDSLSWPLFINPIQDSLRILTYLNESTGFYNYGEYLEHILVFGYSSCEIPVLFQGQSICTWEIDFGYPVCFYKDNSPTLLGLNDTVGATTIIRGTFYDILNQVISHPLFDCGFSISNNVTSYYSDFYGLTFFVSLDCLNFGENDNFSTQVLSGNRNVTMIDNLIENTGSNRYLSLRHLACESFQFNLEPGQVLDQDIHLTTNSYIVGSPELPSKASDLTVVCSPNPFTDQINFYLSADKPIANAEILIFNSSGQLRKSLKVDMNDPSWSGRILKDELGSAGLYLYSVNVNGNKVKSGQIICQ